MGNLPVIIVPKQNKAFTYDTLHYHLKALAFSITDWLQNKTIQRIVLVISNVDSGEVVERWQFDIECDKTMTEDRYNCLTKIYYLWTTFTAIFINLQTL